MKFSSYPGFAYRHFAVFALLPFLVIATSALAQLPSARLTALFPAGAKAGSTTQITLTGVDLDEAAEIRFTHPGISAKPAGDSDSATERKFSVTVAADVPVGIYEARVVGRFGITNPRVFCVGDRQEIVASLEPSTSPTELPLGVALNGRCPANGVNEYSVKLERGKRILIECVTRQIDSRLSPVMTVGTEDGREVARSRKDGLIDFTPAADGVYKIAIHDLLYRGGPEYFYRLSAGTSPHLDAIYPPAGVPGSKSTYTLYGRNLPGGSACEFHAADGSPLERLDVEIALPAEMPQTASPDAQTLLGSGGAGLDAIAYRLPSEQGVSNPVLIGLAPGPMVMEQQPKSTGDNVQKISLPCDVVGRFYPHGDTDRYTFDAEKGDVYWIEVFSERLGLPTCPELLVQRVNASSKGDVVVNDLADLGGPEMQPTGRKGSGASAGFGAPSRDVAYRLEVKDPGTFRLTLRDLFNQSKDNVALTYRLSIHKENPDFRLLATTAPIPDPKNNNNGVEPNLAPPFLRKGGIVPIRVAVLRKDGFDGDVMVEADGLPAGVHCTAATVRASESVATLMLTADEDPQTAIASIRVVGHATQGDQDKPHIARVGAIIWPTVNSGNGSIERGLSRLTTSMPVQVSGTEAEPLSILIEKTALEAHMGEKITIPVKLKWRGGFQQSLKLQPAGLQRGDRKLEMTIPADADSGSFDMDLSETRLPPGTYTFYLLGQAKVKYDRKGVTDEKAPKGEKSPGKDAVFYSSPITLKILPK